MTDVANGRIGGVAGTAVGVADDAGVIVDKLIVGADTDARVVAKEEGGLARGTVGSVYETGGTVIGTGFADVTKVDRVDSSYVSVCASSAA